MKKIVLLLAVFFNFGILFSQVDYVISAQYTVKNSKEIQIFESELGLLENSISRIEVFDLTNNGFDTGDIIKVYPSGNIYPLKPLTPKLESNIKSWRFPENVLIVDDARNYQEYDNIGMKLPIKERFAYSVLSSVKEGLDRNYNDVNKDVKVLFEQEGQSIKFKIWNFSENRIQIKPRPKPAPKIEYRLDTLYVETVSIDTVTVNDTLYLPDFLLKKIEKGKYKEKEAKFYAGFRHIGTKRKNFDTFMSIGGTSETIINAFNSYCSEDAFLLPQFGMRYFANFIPFPQNDEDPSLLGFEFDFQRMPKYDEEWFIHAGARLDFKDDKFFYPLHLTFEQKNIETIPELQSYRLGFKTGYRALGKEGILTKLGAWVGFNLTYNGNNSKYKYIIDDKNFEIENNGSLGLRAGFPYYLGPNSQIVFSLEFSSLPGFKTFMTYPDSLGSVKTETDYSQSYGSIALRLSPMDFINPESDIVWQFFAEYDFLVNQTEEVESDYSFISDNENFTDYYMDFSPYDTSVLDVRMMLEYKIFSTEAGFRFYNFNSPNIDNESEFYGGFFFRL